MRFTPRFAAVAGTEFAIIAWLGGPGGGWRELARVDVPDTRLAPRTVVESIDPGVEVVPANLLRFSLAFSSAMEEGSAAGHIHLLDESGTVMAGSLLAMPPELWDRDRRRLTVLIEPGRIKRGLQPHVQAGAPLREGSNVTLVVEAGMRDADGSPLVEEARRTFRVEPPIRSRIDPTAWEVSWPETPTGPIAVRFDRPLDRLLVQRYLRPIDGSGDPASGHTSLDNTARNWSFTPIEDSNNLRLRVDARLEDLAGNSVRRVFDRDLQRPEDTNFDAAEIVLAPN